MENLVKAVSIIGAILAGAKIIFEFTIGKLSRLREEYRFAKEFLHDLQETDASKKLHPMAVERGYRALAGTRSVPIRDIAYLLELTEPDKQIRDYVLAWAYVEFDCRTGRIQHRRKYSQPSVRRILKWTWSAAYAGFALIAMLPLLIVAPPHEAADIRFWSLVTIPAFGLLAALAMRNSIAIGRGEALVSGQQKHSQIIEQLGAGIGQR